MRDVFTRILLNTVLTPILVVLYYGYMPKIESSYIQREIFQKVADHLEKPEITLITGSRQVGKTVLLTQLQKYLFDKHNVPESRILSYNLDLIQDWELFQNQRHFIEFLKDRSSGGKLYVFVDEAQRVTEAARFFKGVYDSKLPIKLVLTGSSSLELKAKFKETLAGRKLVFPLQPFSFIEFLECADPFLAQSLKDERVLSHIDERKTIDLYREYIVYGGYPRAALAQNHEEKRAVLQEIYSSYVERDVVALMEIRNKASFSRLVKLIGWQIGQLVNIQELATALAVDRMTVDRYFFGLEETFILRRITPYYRNPRQEIVKMGKAYFLDLGIRATALDDFSRIDERKDKGAVLENAVFIELARVCRKRGGKIHFWRTKQKTEVDFVIELGAELIPIEVKYNMSDTALSPGMIGFIKKFEPKKAIVATLIKPESVIRGAPAPVSIAYPYELGAIFARNILML